jgi:hypothetical protein
MYRLLLVCVTGLIVSALTLRVCGDTPQERQAELKTFTVSCKVIRKTWVVVGSNEKATLEKDELKIPDITTLQDTLAEYFSGGKLSYTPFGFRLQVHVLPATASKVRLKVVAEDSSADGSLTRKNSQRVERQVALGKRMKLVLDEKTNGEGVWVELVVREHSEE